MVNRNVRMLQPGGFRAGIHSGRFHASNFRGGIVAVTLSNGDGTTTVTLAKPMPNANYRVLVCSQTDTDNTDLCIAADTKTPKTFVIRVTSTNQSSINVGYLILDTYPSGSLKHSRFGFHSGSAHFRNLQWGKITGTTSAGDATGIVAKFPSNFKHTPLIFASFDDATNITTGFVYINTAATTKQVTLGIKGCSADEAIDLTWLAFDPGFNVGTVQTVGNKKGNLAGQNTQAQGGIHSGELHCKNLFGGLVKMTASSGDIDEAVTFGQMLKNTPIVFAFLQSPVDDITGVAYAKSTSISGVTIGVEASTHANESVYAGYLVFDYEYRQEGAAES